MRGLFEGTGVDLEFERASTEFIADSVAAEIEEGQRELPPIVNAKRVLEPEGKWDALRADLVKLTEAENLAEDGTYRSENEFLVIKGTKSG